MEERLEEKHKEKRKKHGNKLRVHRGREHVVKAAVQS